MKICTLTDELRAEINAARSRSELTGLVPTMGFLHEGHVSLIRKARAECDFVVVTIFVNPMQFGMNEDLDAYPRDLDGDSAACAAAEADLLFAPAVKEVYPGNFLTRVNVAELSEGLCGVHRPGHFEGVATVVTKLFNMVMPDRAYFGRKDAQQLAVICQMARDLNFPIEIVGCPTVREADGLAMSSRNSYLGTAERDAALALISGLRAATDRVMAGERDSNSIVAAARAPMDAHPLVQTEYAELRDAQTIQAIQSLPEDGAAILAVAARVGETRLIDNFRYVTSGGTVEVDDGVLAAAAAVGATS